MNYKDIERLARELAKKHRSQSALKVETPTQTYYEYAPFIKSVIQDILRDHCIVPKSEVKEWVETLLTVMPAMPITSRTMTKIGAKRLFGAELFEVTDQVALSGKERREE